MKARLTGNTYNNMDYIKSIGGRWDTESRACYVQGSKLTNDVMEELYKRNIMVDFDNFNDLDILKESKVADWKYKEGSDYQDRFGTSKKWPRFGRRRK